MTQDRADTQDAPARHVIARGSPMPRATFSPERARSEAGTLVDRYRVVEEIGVGGMASVHLARMDGPGGFQKWVAIKRIHPHLLADESFVRMFLDEARIAARISHPNVATVFELGRHGDTYWIAMEYLHGEPLREVMRRAGDVGGPMPPEIASRVIADAAEGLHSAHELLGQDGEKLHLIHRDVTPHNLFVTYDGAIKVVDFGIAKCSSRMSSTRAGTLKGKLAYMSPEQVRGEPIDRGTDIFSLGVVLWELTTGQRLFRVDSDLGTLAKVRECDVPRPSAIVRAYPTDLEEIVMKALAKNRAERFPTAREFSRALQSLLVRRGLFIASEEVAGYVQFIFRERIRRREAHLRWAGNLARTIHVERLFGASRNLASSGTPSLHTYVSNLEAGAGRAPLLRRSATAHARTRGVGETGGEDADTLVTRRAPDERSLSSRRAASLAWPPSIGAPLDALRHVRRGRQPVPVHPLAPTDPLDLASLRPALAPVQRTPRHRAPNPSRRLARGTAMPVWAAAAISGTLALLPAGAIFVTVSRALRSSTKVESESSSNLPPSTARAPSRSPRGRAPASSPTTTEFRAEPPAVLSSYPSSVGTDAEVPTAPDSASLVEDLDDGSVSSSAP